MYWAKLHFGLQMWPITYFHIATSSIHSRVSLLFYSIMCWILLFLLYYPNTNRIIKKGFTAASLSQKTHQKQRDNKTGKNSFVLKITNLEPIFPGAADFFPPSLPPSLFDWLENWSGRARKKGIWATSTSDGDWANTDWAAYWGNIHASNITDNTHSSTFPKYVP